MDSFSPLMKWVPVPAGARQVWMESTATRKTIVYEADGVYYMEERRLPKWRNRT